MKIGTATSEVEPGGVKRVVKAVVLFYVLRPHVLRSTLSEK